MTGCGYVDGGQPEVASIRIATWNLWWRFGPWEEREPLIIQELQRIDADIVCLQEVWADVGDRPLPGPPEVSIAGPDDDLADSQPARLSAACGYPEFRFAWRYAHGGLAFGNAILSRWPIQAASGLALPAPPEFEEHRTALLVEADSPHGRLPVATTHLNFRWDQSDVRIMQVEGICRFLGQVDRGPLPVVLTGDLNAEASSEEIRRLNGRAPVPVKDLGFFDAWEVAGDGPGHTWTRENGFAAEISMEADRRIDYVFAGYPDVTTRAGRIGHAERFGTKETAGIHPTDHFGVLADLVV